MSTMPTLPGGTGDNLSGKKSFWSKPEGKTGLIVNTVLIAALIYFWGSIVPFLLSAAEDTLHLIVVCTAIAAILYVAFDSNFRRFLWYGYRSMMRWITQWFVDLNPISILKTYMEKLTEKKAELDAAVGEIKGQRQKLARDIEKNNTTFEASMSKLNAAKAQQNDSDPNKRHQAGRIVGVESKQVARLEALLKMQTKHMQKFDFIVTVLTRYGEVCEDSITDMGHEIKFREQERDQAKSFHKGMSAAFGILKGMPDDQEMYDMALESLERDYTTKMGEVENALDLTKTIIMQADFNDEAAMQKADALLNKWRNDNADAQMGKGGVTKQQLLSAAETGIPMSMSVNQGVPVYRPVGQSGDYDKMFD